MPIATAGTTNRSEYFYIVGDASNASPGDPITGLLFSDIETGGSASYMRQGATRTDLTLITQTVGGAHSDGGFVEVDATNMPGVYRCDFPDAAYATGVDFVVCQIVVAAANNAVAAPIQVDITDFDLRTANVTLEATTHTGAVIPTVTTTTTATNLTNLPTIPANWITAAGINSGAIDADAIAADALTAAKFATNCLTSDELDATFVNEIWAKIIETQGSYTAQQALSIALSVLAGVTSSGGDVLETPDGVSTRVTATIDGSNNRTAMSLTPSS